MYINWIENIISLKHSSKLNVDNVEKLKKLHGSENVELVLSCINNDIEKLEEYIQRGYDLSICNDKVLRFTVSEGYVELSKLLLKNGVDVN